MAPASTLVAALGLVRSLSCTHISFPRFGLGNLGFILLSAYVVRTWIEARRDAEGLQAFKYKHKGA